MLKIKIVTDGAAFQDPTMGRRDEIARIVRQAAAKILEGNSDFPLLDVNGNRVGYAKLTD